MLNSFAKNVYEANKSNQYIARVPVYIYCKRIVVVISLALPRANVCCLADCLVCSFFAFELNSRLRDRHCHAWRLPAKKKQNRIVCVICQYFSISVFHAHFFDFDSKNNVHGQKFKRAQKLKEREKKTEATVGLLETQTKKHTMKQRQTHR